MIAAAIRQIFNADAIRKRERLMRSYTGSNRGTRTDLEGRPLRPCHIQWATDGVSWPESTTKDRNLRISRSIRFRPEYRRDPALQAGSHTRLERYQ